ncbi:MAG: hypothetical protein V3V49_15390 [Candidatus Krumholzibacteria bacterium]
MEAKISRAVEKFAELEAARRTLQEKNEKTEGQLRELRLHNNELSKQIFELKTAKTERPVGLVEEKKILNKIDRMLEKFGELQI